MTRKRWFVAMAAATLACAAGAAVLIVFSASDVTKANYRRLKGGMEKGEVSAILGGSPYRTESGGCTELWIGYEGSIRVHYDEHKKIGLDRMGESAVPQTVS